MNGILEAMRQWQTLIAGLLALGAAIIGFYFISQQIRQSEKQYNLTESLERKRIENKEIAARAVLPITLIAITEYADNCFKILKQALETREGEIIPQNKVKIEMPLISQEIISSLKELIEVADTETVKLLQNLIKKTQIQNSRLRTLVERDKLPQHIILVANVETYIIDAAIVLLIGGEIISLCPI